MLTDSQIQNRLDAGDFSGATRLAARQKIAEVKMQRDAALTSAMEQFYDAYPEFGERWKYYTKLMREWLVAGGVDPAGASYQDLENAWSGIKGKRIRPVESTAAHTIQSQPQAPPAEDPITVEAKRLIAEGRITVETVNALNERQAERLSRDAVFCRAVELLFPKRSPSPLTSGEIGDAVGRANLETSKGNAVTAADKIAEMERWKEAHFAQISAVPQRGSGAQRGIVNLHSAMHMPKLATEAQLAAAIKHEKEDRKFLEEVALKMERARRVKAHRGRQ